MELQDQYESSMMKKKALEEELEDLEGKLLRAEKLLSGVHAQSSNACTQQPSAYFEQVLSLFIWRVVLLATYENSIDTCCASGLACPLTTRI